MAAPAQTTETANVVTTQEVGNQSVEQGTNKLKNNKKIIIVAAIVVALLLLIVIVVILGNGSKKENGSSSNSSKSKADYVCTMDISKDYPATVTTSMYFNKDGYGLTIITKGEFKPNKLTDEIIHKIIEDYSIYDCEDSRSSYYDEEICAGKKSFASSTFGLSTVPSVSGNTFILEGTYKAGLDTTLSSSEIQEAKDGMVESGFQCK